MMRLFLLHVILFTPLLRADEGVSVEFVPAKKLVPLFTASGTEHRVSYAKHLTSGTFSGSMGGSLPAADVRAFGLLCQVSAGGSVHTTLRNAGAKFSVTNADFVVDITFDVPVSDATIVRTGWGHTSHHLADDAVGAGLTPNNYARDYYALYGVHTLPFADTRVYAGVQYSYSFLINTRIDGQWMPHLGGEGTFLRVWNGAVLYGAADIKLRGELEYGSTQSFQVGLKAQSPLNRNLRLAYTFRTGLEERGQFYDRRTATHTIGLYFDL